MRTDPTTGMIYGLAARRQMNPYDVAARLVLEAWSRECHEAGAAGLNPDRTSGSWY